MSNGQRPMVGARVPHHWKEQIQSICRESGKSESEVVQEALACLSGARIAQMLKYENDEMVG